MADNVLMQARNLLNRGLQQAAADLLAKAIDTMPAPLLLLELARVRLMQQRLDEARELIKRANILKQQQEAAALAINLDGPDGSDIEDHNHILRQSAEHEKQRRYFAIEKKPANPEVAQQSVSDAAEIKSLQSQMRHIAIHPSLKASALIDTPPLAAPETLVAVTLELPVEQMRVSTKAPRKILTLKRRASGPISINSPPIKLVLQLELDGLEPESDLQVQPVSDTTAASIEKLAPVDELEGPMPQGKELEPSLPILIEHRIEKVEAALEADGWAQDRSDEEWVAELDLLEVETELPDEILADTLIEEVAILDELEPQEEPALDEGVLIEEGPDFEFEERPTRDDFLTEIAAGGKQTRRQRAEQVAIDLGLSHGWDADGIALLTNVFERHWWSQCKLSMERELTAGMTPDELCLAIALREFWSERSEFWIELPRFNPSTRSSDRASAKYRNLSWPLALALVRAPGGQTEIEELECLLDGWFDEWYTTARYQRSFRSFHLYITYRLGRVRSSLAIWPQWSFAAADDPIWVEAENFKPGFTTQTTCALANFGLLRTFFDQQAFSYTPDKNSPEWQEYESYPPCKVE